MLSTVPIYFPLVILVIKARQPGQAGGWAFIQAETTSGQNPHNPSSSDEMRGQVIACSLTLRPQRPHLTPILSPQSCMSMDGAVWPSIPKHPYFQLCGLSFLPWTTWCWPRCSSLAPASILRPSLVNLMWRPFFLPSFPFPPPHPTILSFKQGRPTLLLANFPHPISVSSTDLAPHSGVFLGHFQIQLFLFFI